MLMVVRAVVGSMYASNLARDGDERDVVRSVAARISEHRFIEYNVVAGSVYHLCVPGAIRGDRRRIGEIANAYLSAIADQDEFRWSLDVNESVRVREDAVLHVARCLQPLRAAGECYGDIADFFCWMIFSAELAKVSITQQAVQAIIEGA